MGLGLDFEVLAVAFGAVVRERLEEALVREPEVLVRGLLTVGGGREARVAACACVGGLEEEPPLGGRMTLGSLRPHSGVTSPLGTSFFMAEAPPAG